MAPFLCLIASLNTQTLPGMAHSEALSGSGNRDMQACSTEGLGHMRRYKWLRIDNKPRGKSLRCTLQMVRMLCTSWMIVALLAAQLASQLKHMSLYQFHIPAICDLLYVHCRYTDLSSCHHYQAMDPQSCQD